ncbi:MAG: hypothetical protein DME82_03805 [Verrucomicrobia bacterium]|nr:MAG: hypothetical protein DME82_03805 [Verrucomicrobiota bacterium]
MFHRNGFVESSNACLKISPPPFNRCISSLFFDVALLLQELPVWIYLEAPFFAVRSDDDLVIPFAIRVVFSFDPNDLSARCL